jgi:hypothetical protein
MADLGVMEVTIIGGEADLCADWLEIIRAILAGRRVRLAGDAHGGGACGPRRLRAMGTSLPGLVPRLALARADCHV